MILSRALAFAALPLLAVATHGLHKARTNSGACSTGTLQCCESVGQSSSPALANMLEAVGIQLGADVPVGLTCTPITVLGVGGASPCSANAVCCENNSFGGLVSVGCVPVIL
ncbi:fungal hydrophobin-domain-containing protein [Earliella scabrosa]|nr:fungal hydrophobin-domain-containing protein [Earliella scabrosa]